MMVESRDSFAVGGRLCDEESGAVSKDDEGDIGERRSKIR